MCVQKSDCLPQDVLNIQAFRSNVLSNGIVNKLSKYTKENEYEDEYKNEKRESNNLSIAATELGCIGDVEKRRYVLYMMQAVEQSSKFL